MKYKNIQSIILIVSLLLFSACNSSTSSETTTPIDSSSSADSQTDDATTTTSSEDEVESENDIALSNAAINMDDLIVNVHNNTFKTTSNYYTSTNQMLSDFTRMSQSVTDRMSAEMELLNKLAKPFEIASDYTSLFSVNNDYTAVSPAFVISKALTNNYFLVSSQSKFYLQGKTIKTFFKDTNSLANAWSRAITNADKTKDLYLTLLEIDSDGNVTQVTNSFVVKSATLETY